MNDAKLLPDDIEIESDQHAQEIVEEARAELSTRPADANASTLGANAGTDSNEGTRMEEARAEKQAAQQQEEVVQPAADIPQELVGLTRRQLADRYRQAQSVIGRQGGELGELRRHADALIKERLAAVMARQPAPAAAKPAQRDPVDEDVTYFVSPADAVKRAVEAQVKPLKELAQRVQQERVVQGALSNEATFKREFPDAQATLANPAFQQWVEKSPVRQKMLLAAHHRYDLNAAREVFGNWRDIMAQPAQRQAQPQQRQQVKAPAQKREVFRRVDVLRLMETDSDRYAEMADRIAAAYARGDVK